MTPKPCVVFFWCYLTKETRTPETLIMTDPKNSPEAFVFVLPPPSDHPDLAWVHARYRVLAVRIEKELSILLPRHDPGRYVQVFTRPITEVACERGIEQAIAGYFGGKNSFLETGCLNEEDTSTDKLISISEGREEIPIFITPHSCVFATHTLATTTGQGMRADLIGGMTGLAKALIVVPSLKGCVLISAL